MSDKTVAKLLASHPRVRALRPGSPDPEGRCIAYWMQRAQRGVDNPALNLAIALGNAVSQPVLCVFGLTANYPSAQRRHYRFLLEGLLDAHADLTRRGVPLVVRLGQPGEIVPVLAEESGASLVVGDENPVRIGQSWREKVASRLKVPFYLVDADVVVPTSLFPNAAEPQPKSMSKTSVLPPEWAWNRSQSGGERREDAVALRRQVYQPDRRCALLL